MPGKVVWAKSSGEEDNNDEVSLKDSDWREFRAKLVMGEKKRSSGDPLVSSTSGTSTNTSGAAVGRGEGGVEEIVEDSDLDGIGSLF